MSKIALRISYNRLKNYSENELREKIKFRIEEEPNDNDKYGIKYDIVFDEAGCIIYAESKLLNENMLHKYISGSIMCIERDYESISNVSLDILGSEY